MKASAWLWLVGAILVVAGTVIGFSPVHADGYSCGSAFHERSGLLSDELYDTMTGGTGQNGCDDARSNRKVFAWTPIAIGLVVVLGGFVASNQEGARRREASTRVG